jgi:hypothetical protein
MAEARADGTTAALVVPDARTARWRPEVAEVAIALAAFAGLCVAVLVKSTALLEPDDLAYRASIVALTHGQLTLSNVQYEALSKQVGGIAQWVQLSNGRWISEKNPGYPFFAAPFQVIGALRLAPLAYGALGCVGLFFGGRRWLGRMGGAWAVVLFCCSGAAMVFAWRATMPTFTDASLVAAGTGGLLWAMLATDASRRARTVAGLLAFVALEGATLIRYTNGVVLVVAVSAVLLTFRAARLPLRSVAWWLGSVAAFGALVATFDALVYGGVTKTGYGSGEITFALGAVRPNLEHMPRHLVSAMPLLVLALVAVGWIAVRAFRGRDEGRRRDAAVAGALVATWLAVYGLYAAYTWTVRLAPLSGTTLQVVRFYVPALGAVALLAAWLVQRLPRWVPVVALAAVVGLAVLSYSHLSHGGFGGGLPGIPQNVGGPGGQRLPGLPGGFRPGNLPGGPPPGGFPSGGPPAGAPPGASPGG